MRWPLRYQILVPFAGVMLAVVLGVSLLDAYLAASRTQQRIEGQLRDVAQTLLEASFPLTDAVLEQTRGLSGAEFVLVGEAGKRLATTLHRIDASRLSRDRIEGDELTLSDPLSLDGQEYFHAAVAVRPSAGQVGPLTLHILYPRRQLQEARLQAAYPPLVVGAAFLGVVIVLAIVIARRVSRPVLALRRQLNRLVQGDFEPVPLPVRDDELRDLVDSANRLADQLDDSQRAIKRTERFALLGQLSGGLAHQLRNSVAGARMAVQLHQRQCQDADPDSLRVALRQLTLTESHLQQLLTVGQPSEPRSGLCDLKQVVADVKTLVLPTCKHRNVSFWVDHEAGAGRPLWADATQLRQLLLNLVLNSIEAAGKGGWVRVEIAGDDDRTTLRVLDSGPGLDDQLRDRLFEPFATGKPEGVGLGLAVSKRIAEAHGGTVDCKRQRPTCFEVCLPYRHDLQVSHEAVDPAMVERAARRHIGTLNVEATR